MAAGDQLRTAALEIHKSIDLKKRQLDQQKQTIDNMKRQIDQMTQGLANWQREIALLE